MKYLSIILISATLAGCNTTTQRVLGFGPAQYCRDHDVCAQAGETWQVAPFAPGDSIRFAEESRQCWRLENKLNWDTCTHRIR